MHVWKTLQLFVSSTFLDLELERDRLSRMFSRIKQELTARHLCFIPYDLRWREKDSRDPIARWCLEMVRQCQYFVGILGARYGWRPPQDACGNPNHDRLSITEMEINQALRDIPRERRFFCFAEDHPSRKESEEDRASLKALKNRLKASGEEIYEFKEISEIMDTVERKIRSMIERDYPPEAKASLEEYTRQDALRDILEEKNKGFVGRSGYLKKLEAFALEESPKNYLAVHGVAGTGKSSVAARFITEWKEGHPEIPVVAHFMSMGENSRQVREVVYGLAHQMAQFNLISSPLQEDPAELRAQLRAALENCSKKMVIVIDGLDEIEETGHDLLWLPKNISSPVRTIITTRPVSPWERLREYARLETLELPLLSEAEISEIISNYAKSNHLWLSESDSQLLQKRAAGNPLYLKVALEEVMMSGIAVGQLATSIDRLFEQILQRLSGKYGEKIIFDYLGSIAASRSGLTQHELRELIMGTESRISYTDDFLLSVTKALEHFIIRRGSLYSFFHPEFERTLKQRLGRGEMRAYHKRLAAYFESKGTLYERTLMDLCYQRQWAEEYDELLNDLTHLPFLEAKLNAGMADGLAEDFQFALHSTAVPLPAHLLLKNRHGVFVGYRTILALSKAYQIDLRFVRRHPQAFFQAMWNRCYWYDSPEAEQHYDTSHCAYVRPKHPDRISDLVEKWREEKEKRAGFRWLRSKRPVEPHLDSPMRKIFKGHDAEVWGLSLDRENKRVASTSTDEAIKIWDIQTGECLTSLEGHQGKVSGVVFTHDGKRVISGGEDWMVLAWESESGECVEIMDGHEGPVTCLALSSDGENLLSGSEDGSARLWKLSDWKCASLLAGHKEAVLCVALSPDGKKAATGSKDQTIWVWDLETKECLAVLSGHERMVNGLAFASDGSRLASGSKDGTVKVWEVEKGQCLYSFNGGAGAVNGILMHPEKPWILAGTEGNMVFLLDFSTQEVLKRFFRKDWKVSAIEVDQEWRRMICGARDGSLSIWDLTASEVSYSVEGHQEEIKSLCTGHRKSVSASKDKTIKVWDLTTGKCARTFVGHEAPVYGVAISEDGKKIASSSDGGVVCLWNAGRGECIHALKQHRGIVSHVFFHSGDRKIVSVGFHDNTIRVWDMLSGECLQVLSGHERWIEQIAFSHDKKLIASGSRDKTARIWDLENGKCLRILRGHEKSVTSVAFRADDVQMASGCYDGQIRLWNVESGACLMILQGHRDIVESVAFSQDGSTLFSSSREKNVKMWDLSTGECVKTLEGKTDAAEMARQDNSVFALVKDWETIFLKKGSWEPFANWPEPMESVFLLESRTITGKGKLVNSYLYILDVEESP